VLGQPSSRTDCFKIKTGLRQARAGLQEEKQASNEQKTGLQQDTQALEVLLSNYKFLAPTKVNITLSSICNVETVVQLV
jgi:hypothetical protein